MFPQESAAPLALPWLRTFLLLEVLGTGIWVVSRLLKAFDTSFCGFVRRCKLAVFGAAASVWELAAEHLDQACSWDYDEGNDFDCICDCGGILHMDYNEDDEEMCASLTADEEPEASSIGLISFYPGRFVDDELAARIEDAARRRGAVALGGRSCIRTGSRTSRPCARRHLRWAEVTAGDVQEYHAVCATAFRPVGATAAPKAGKGRHRVVQVRDERSSSDKEASPIPQAEDPTMSSNLALQETQAPVEGSGRAERFPAPRRGRVSKPKTRVSAATGGA